MSLLTMTDCSDADNRAQARYELNKDPVSTMYLADWAMKWGRALLDYADACPSEDDVANDVAVVESELVAVQNQREDYHDAIEAAIRRLDKIETNETTRDAIDAIIADLENSL